MEWKNLEEDLDKVAERINYLEDEIKKLGQILERYSENLNGTLEECVDFRKLQNTINEVEKELENLKEKVSDEILIVIVGPTSSGKSSLINCLLRGDHFPVDILQSTMCLIRVCKSSSSKWEVTVDGKPLKIGDQRGELKKLLDLLCDREAREQRELLKITEGSVVNVYWPKDLCTGLPENVVLVDTPGYGESEESNKVVIESCKKALIIVPVMSITSPSINTISELLKETNCQFTCGVYTKWDRYKESRLEKDCRASEEFVRGYYERKYQEGISSDKEDEDLVFFVDVGSVQKIKEAEDKGETDGENEFFNFEKSLVKSAKEKKGKLLKKQAISVISKSEEALLQFQTIVEKRTETTKGRLTKEISTCETGISKFKKPEEQYNVLNVLETETWLKEFEDGLRGGTAEKQLLENFCDKVNKKIKDIVIGKTKMLAEEFEEWLDEVQLSPRMCWSWEELENVPQLEHRELQNCHYQPLLDFPYSCATSNYTWGVFLSSVAAASAFGGFSYSSLEAGAFVGALLTCFTKEVLHFGIGDIIKKKFPISEKLLSSWKQSLKDELTKIESDNKTLISREINRLFNKISSRLLSVKDQACKEVAKLDCKEHDLHEWVREADECQQALRKIKCFFEELLTETDGEREESDNERSFNRSKAKL